MLVWNLLLMLVWCALFGDFNVKNLAGGFLIGYVALMLLASRGVVGSPRYLRRVRRIVSFLAFFLKELVLANIRVAREVMRPGTMSKPAIVAIPLREHTEVELTLLATLIAITPGTMCMDISTNRRTLYLHVMDLENGDTLSLRHGIRDGFEARVVEVFR